MKEVSPLKQSPASSLPRRMHEYRTLTIGDGSMMMTIGILRVPGGWLYIGPNGQTYVPEMLFGDSLHEAKAIKDLYKSASADEDLIEFDLTQTPEK